MTREVQEHIVVTVAPDGSITAETKGIKGDACLDYIQVLEDLLGATTTSSAFTEEHGQTAHVHQHEVSHDVQQQ